MDPTHARSESETIWVLSDSEVEESDMEDGEEIASMSLNGENLTKTETTRRVKHQSMVC